MFLESVVQKVTRFQWGQSPKIFESLQCSNASERCERRREAQMFCRVVDMPMYKECKKLQEAHESQGSCEVHQWEFKHRVAQLSGWNERLVGEEAIVMNGGGDNRWTCGISFYG